MSERDWLLVEVGDVLVDPHTGARREVMSVTRCSGKRGQRGMTRTMVHVPNIKSKRWRETTILASTDGYRARCLVLEKRPMSGAIEFHDPGDEHRLEEGWTPK